MSAETESDLVERCRAGDHDAFRELLEFFHARVFAVAYALTRDSTEAAEVEQETFIKAARSPATLAGGVVGRPCGARRAERPCTLNPSALGHVERMVAATQAL